MRAEFDKYAGSYEELLRDPIRDRFAATGEFFHLRKWLLLRRLLESRRARLAEMGWLDVGCGKGELLRFGSAAFGRAVGCDPSLEMLRECGGLTVEHQPEAARLPFADASFDVVTAACVYHHLSRQDQHALACEARRVLRPGGVFVIFEHNPWNPATRLIVSRTPVDANAVLLTGGECRNVVRAAGLAVENTVYYLFLP
jgi:SAM-dependent methyltransferase